MPRTRKQKLRLINRCLAADSWRNACLPVPADSGEQRRQDAVVEVAHEQSFIASFATLTDMTSF
jgi:hypothetical protein